MIKCYYSCRHTVLLEGNITVEKALNFGANIAKDLVWQVI